jgi:hypothetical protein
MLMSITPGVGAHHKIRSGGQGEGKPRREL